MHERQLPPQAFAPHVQEVNALPPPLSIGLILGRQTVDRGRGEHPASCAEVSVALALARCQSVVGGDESQNPNVNYYLSEEMSLMKPLLLRLLSGYERRKDL